MKKDVKGLLILDKFNSVWFTLSFICVNLQCFALPFFSAVGLYYTSVNNFFTKHYVLLFNFFESLITEITNPILIIKSTIFQMVLPNAILIKG